MPASRILPAVLSLLIGCASPQAPPPPSPPPTRPISVETHFSPEEEIAPTIVKLIDSTKQTLDIAAFAYTHSDIAAATIRAHGRGVRVQIAMDTTNAAVHSSLAPDL